MNELNLNLNYVNDDLQDLLAEIRNEICGIVENLAEEYKREDMGYLRKLVEDLGKVARAEKKNRL